MKARPNCRQLVPLAAVAAYVGAGCLVYHSSAASPLASSGLLGQSAVLSHVLDAPKAAPAIPKVHTTATSIASTDSPYYRNAFPAAIPSYPLARTRLSQYAGPDASPYAVPHTSTGDPVVLESYSTSEVVHITNAASGQTVRAPQSSADTSIGPNVPLTFTVKVNNDTATTTASAVYIQIKNPNSAYQGNDGFEHKVFTQDPFNPNYVRQDSGSSSLELYNGGNGEPSYLVKQGVEPSEEGAVGGTEGTEQFLGIGFDAGLAPLSNNYSPNAAVTNFQSLGQEYECQYLDPFDNGVSTPANPSGYTGTQDASASNYGTPYYLAGYDDQKPGSFGSGATQVGAGNHGVPTDANGNDWLQLHQESSGSDFYQATWCPPHTASDFYLDVIVVDNQKNWRVYDNVWGFSTQPFQGNNDILFVADNVLGQKFPASALANSGITNLRPTFYGAESYLTDVSFSDLPNAVYDYQTPTGANAPVATVSPLTDASGVTESDAVNTGTPVINSLGYGSYSDSVNYDTGIAQYHLFQVGNNLPNGNTSTNPQYDVPKSQAYSIWRILCRGPLDPTLLTKTPAQGGYAPDNTTTSQPAVSDPVSGFTAPAASNVVVATRCVVWASPFTGDQPLNVGGTIDDPATQAELRQFVANGGRLFVTGQEVATAITNGGQTQNAAGGFVYDVLNAQFTSSGAGSDNQTVTGTTGNGHPIGNDAYFNFLATPAFDSRNSNYYLNTFTGPAPYTPPGAVSPLVIGNNYIFSADQGLRQKWRTDDALTQLGPYVETLGSSRLQSAISVVTPVNGAIADYSLGGGNGLIEKSNYTSAAGSGYGSKVVFASFGLEGLSNEYYEQTAPNNGPHEFFVHNDRANIMHNVVNWLRTGSYQGRIFLGNSNQVGIAGATVYLVPFGGATIPGPRQTYSATTSDGSNGPIGFYHMDGVEPGAYIAVAYKTGYTESRSPTNNFDALPFTVAGDTTVNNVNLNISPLPPGGLTGTVTDSTTGNPVSGATVTFTSSDGTSTVTATTNASGLYTVAAPSGTYTGVATETSPSGTSTPVTGITVTTGQTATQNFTITVNPGTVTGTVVNGATSAGISGVTVAFTPTGAAAGTAPTATATTGTNGTFTSPGLPTGTYTITVSAAGFYSPAAIPTVTVTQGTTTNAGTITLQVATTVTLNVTVNSTAGTPLNTATISVKDLAGNTVVTTPSPLTSNGSGVYSGTLSQGTYLISASAVGYLTATTQVTVTNNPTAMTLTLATAASATTYSGGKFHLISWPYAFVPSGVSAFDQIFGALATHDSNGNLVGNRSNAYNYDADISSYITDPAFPADGLRPGYGYFIYLYSPVSVFTGGIAGTPVTSPVTVPLKKGWNMIGVPSASAISVSSLSLQVNGSTYSFGQAVSLIHALSGTLYSYNPDGPPAAPYTAVTGGGSLQPYQGYWLYATVPNTSLIIPNG